MFTGTDALIEETTLHGVARERKRRSEVLACCPVSAAAKLKFAAGGRIVARREKIFLKLPGQGEPHFSRKYCPLPTRQNVLKP